MIFNGINIKIQIIFSILLIILKFSKKKELFISDVKNEKLIFNVKLK